MATKDITDVMIVRAVLEWNRNRQGPYPYEALAVQTGQSEKVCYRAMERAAKRGYLDYGVSLRTGWLTDSGKELLIKGGEVGK